MLKQLSKKRLQHKWFSSDSRQFFSAVIQILVLIFSCKGVVLTLKKHIIKLLECILGLGVLKVLPVVFGSWD